MLKILHTGDIHLDSPFSRLDARRSEIRRAELRAAFVSMMHFARENGVDIVLIAGDLFDNEYVTRETVALLVREFARFEKPIVIAPGNHDCITEGGVWDKIALPQNVFLFRTSSLSKFSFDGIGADVYGYAFTSPERTDSPLSGATLPNDGRIHLLCAHGDLGVPLSRYCPITRGELLALGADYAALGHVHNPTGIVTDGHRAYGYCGCLEGRAPDEIGPKGAVYIEIDKSGTASSIRTKRIRFSRRRYEAAEIDCTGADTLTAIESAIGAEIDRRGFSEDTLLRVTLTGAVSPSLVVDTRTIEARFPTLFSLEIKDGTTVLLNPRDFENDRTVRGAFYRAMAKNIENGTPREREIAVRALRYGLAAIAGENISDL